MNEDGATDVTGATTANGAASGRDAEPDFLARYHRWYYEDLVWTRTSFLGVPCFKSVLDLWNYQEILCELQPGLVLELGTYKGGSALFFAHLLDALAPDGRVLTVDHKPRRLDPRVSGHPRIELLVSKTTDPAVAARVAELRAARPGPLFAILDSNHTCANVLAEMLLLRPLLRGGDYLVVEDGNINGHPVLAGFGDGPAEAIARYEELHPGDYLHDREREGKFGFTFAPNGYLIRRPPAGCDPAPSEGRRAGD
jgi:cephalosporin hydroxylase